jgi:hypothetical protein
MGLKGCRLWVMGQLDSNVQRPTVTVHKRIRVEERPRLVRHDRVPVVVEVAAFADVVNVPGRQRAVDDAIQQMQCLSRVPVGEKRSDAREKKRENNRQPSEREV